MIMNRTKAEKRFEHAEKTGLAVVLTGNGKGKTTSALGMVLRSAGHGLRVCMIQFMKGDCRPARSTPSSCSALKWRCM